MPYKLSMDEIERTLYPQLFRRGKQLGYRFNAGEADVEDIVGDTILKLYESLERIDASTNINAYAERIMQNKFIDRYRSGTTRRTNTFSETELDEEIIDPANLYGEREYDPEDTEQIHWWIASLDKEACREILNLWCDEKDYSSIADILNVEKGTVMSRLSRCKAELITLAREHSEFM